MRKALVVILLGLLTWAVPILAADIPAGVKADLDGAGIEVYPGAVYCIGSADMGVRFATKDSPEAVREWFRKKYPGWSVREEFGMWTLYDGPPGKDFGDIVSFSNVNVQTNKQLPGWHSLPEDMTTEILIALPQ
ncbi:MAG: hypothetical protein JSV26_01545 [bacterium]|nr:MAG: hypothetical protein JSV26_01545 [bacterium]